MMDNSSNQVPPSYFDLLEMVFGEFGGAIIIDQHGIIRIFTDYYEKESGLKKEEVLGKRIDKVFPHTRLLEVLKTGKPILADIWHLNGKAQIVSRFPIKQNGKVIGAAGFSLFKMGEAREFTRRLTLLVSELQYYSDELKKLSGAHYALDSIVGESDAILEAKERVRVVAGTDLSVLITGETGTGKELFAHAIHNESARKDFTLVSINCASIPEALVESELFGYEEGSFTGAKKGGKPGKFEQADKGSIFLDEISELAYPAQAKLLRVLQEMEFERVGGTRPVKVDVRVIAATNTPLNRLVREGKFRRDLFFRINSFPIYIPPLRERPEDILPLTYHFINQVNQEIGTEIEGITREAERLLLSYHWPGNVRELKNLIERAAIAARRGKIVPENVLRFADPDAAQIRRTKRIRTARAEAEKEAIKRALKVCHGNKSQAASMLGMSRSTFYAKLKKYDLDKN